MDYLIKSYEEFVVVSKGDVIFSWKTKTNGRWHDEWDGHKGFPFRENLDKRWYEKNGDRNGYDLYIINTSYHEIMELLK